MAVLMMPPALTMREAMTVHVILGSLEMDSTAPVSYKIIQYDKCVYFQVQLFFIDIDECSLNLPCDSNAICTDTVGSFTCQCRLGFTGNGTNCEGDIFTYVHVVQLHVCMYTVLRYMYGNFALVTCFSLDIDECSDPDLNVCDTQNGTCNNSVGSYSCQCNIGFTGNGSVCTGKISRWSIL